MTTRRAPEGMTMAALSAQINERRAERGEPLLDDNGLSEAGRQRVMMARLRGRPLLGDCGDCGSQNGYERMHGLTLCPPCFHDRLVSALSARRAARIRAAGEIA